jgi:type VI secretion system secreted protein Hcp
LSGGVSLSAGLIRFFGDIAVARSDMFLKATGQRSGAINGEADDKSFANQIEILDWSWGMSSPSAVGGQPAGRVAMKELRIVKKADKASTALMSVMSTNELLPKVELTVRKAGGNSPLPYFVVKLEQARINGYDVHSGIGVDGGPALTEQISFTFKTITIDYTLQSSTGSAVGASSFTGQSGPN